ncbi:hypothetical protein COCCADRAFT_95273 [Bipolaris zeicola 26-R-13]|uniref:Uncharacterized protein n=1 Tax=Cochliobolus carbonum (strain 26-R-13) TaxID=930089 RepID=W6Y211_COCC2|nr:uncharacterized protein COCCADRAFT_95273 [Bipolaris zeicola 26-R-13]EUC33742.1 hypothetical protein COCCADRAFT_95273 [Bipolaris zeicola 26-R-13]
MPDLDCDVSLTNFSIFLWNSTAYNVCDEMNKPISHAAPISRRTKKTPHRYMTKTYAVISGTSPER